MPSFVVYDVETGDIVRIGFCEESCIGLQSNDGEAVIVGSADPNLDRVIDGNVVKKDIQEIEKKDIINAEFNLRSTRNSLLYASDWTQLPDAPVDQAAWAAYRQQLRDLPENTVDPREVVWPDPPA